MKTAQLLSLILLAGRLAAQSTVVAPNANASAAGNATDPFPATAGSMEYQELVGSGQMPPGPIQITGLAFRAAPGTGPLSATIDSLSVYLSSSPNFPNTSGTGKTLMSPTFANNVGLDKTLVFSGTNISLSDPGCTGAGPCPFVSQVVFSTPFPYNSSAGPLLIDLLETNLNGKSGAFDAVSSTAPGGSVAQVAGTLGSAAGTFSYQGNVVQLTYTTATATGPTFTGVVNPASNIPPGLPNSGIAQGSIFVAYGNNLGPASLAQATSLPLPTSGGLAGTAVSITSGGNTVAAPIVYTYTGQVAAILPSTVPVGTATLTVQYNGKTGSTPITVVASNFGISTVNESGSGAAVVTFPNYSVVSNTNSAAPGDTLVLWGTGLGALPAGQSDANAAAGGNLPASIQVFVGGVPATVLYQGRTPSAVGLDQINFMIPQNAPLGCNVGIIVQTTSPTATVSNAPTISLAATDGATCSDPLLSVPTSYLSKSSLKVAYVGLGTQALINGSSMTSQFQATAIFLQFSQAQLMAQGAAFNTEPSLGSCLTQIVTGSGSLGLNGLPNATYLNAGSSVTLTPPAGPQLMLPSMTQGNMLFYQNSSLTAIPSGSWGVSDGAGGSGVGPLNFNFPVPAKVAWTNMPGGSIARNQPLTITWTGGDANGYVDIQGAGPIGPSGAPNYTFYFDCAAPTSAGQFTIPSAIMTGMPANSQSSLQVSTYGYPIPSGVTVPGFDVFVNSLKNEVNLAIGFK